jgi:hypothetical protein
MAKRWDVKYEFCIKNKKLKAWISEILLNEENTVKWE